MFLTSWARSTRAVAFVLPPHHCALLMRQRQDRNKEEGKEEEVCHGSRRGLGRQQELGHQQAHHQCLLGPSVQIPTRGALPLLLYA
jgi:hypothetical protein